MVRNLLHFLVAVGRPKKEKKIVNVETDRVQYCRISSFSYKRSVPFPPDTKKSVTLWKQHNTAVITHDRSVVFSTFKITEVKLFTSFVPLIIL